jgi:hypothetical protein
MDLAQLRMGVVEVTGQKFQIGDEVAPVGERCFQMENGIDIALNARSPEGQNYSLGIFKLQELNVGGFFA